jgi:hypothetical protein
MKLKSYVSSASFYEILHPESYLVNEDEEHGNVTITSPDGNINFTISTYFSESIITESTLKDLFDCIPDDMTPISAAKSGQSNKYFFIEQQFEENDNCWLWKAIGSYNRAIVVSVNSIGPLTEEEQVLVALILEKLEIH